MALLYLHSFKPKEHQMTSKVIDAKMYTGQMFPALMHHVWRCQTAQMEVNVCDVQFTWCSHY